MKDVVTIKRWYPPKAVIVSPALRPGSKQLTVIRHDYNGQYFVDEFTERSSVPTKEDRRNTNWIQCPLLEFQIAMVACSHYCSKPCAPHLKKVAEQGWYTNGEKPPYGDRMTKKGLRSVSSDD